MKTERINLKFYQNFEVLRNIEVFRPKISKFQLKFLKIAKSHPKSPDKPYSEEMLNEKVHVRAKNDYQERKKDLKKKEEKKNITVKKLEFLLYTC